MDGAKTVRHQNQTSIVRQEKCPTSALKKFRKHETVNLIRLKQTVKTNTLDDEHNERAEEKSRKGLRTRFTHAGRRNGERCENLKRYYCP